MKYSFIVPAYNAENEIDRCIESIVNQKCADFELIIVNDGSTDSTSDKLKKYESTYNNITVINQENKGLSAARNEGLKYVNGDYIIFVDSDDYVNKNSCDYINKIIEKHGDIDIVIFDEYRITKSTSKRIIRSNINNDKVYTGLEYMKCSMREGLFNAQIPLNIYSRDFWISNRFKFREGILHEDMQLSLFLFLNANRVVHSDFCHYYRVIRDGSITQNEYNRIRRYNDIEIILCEWLQKSNELEDSELKEIIRGAACKYYINAIAFNNIYTPRFDKIKKKYLIRHALNTKEKTKAIILSISPRFYILLWSTAKKVGLV